MLREQYLCASVMGTWNALQICFVLPTDAGLRMNASSGLQVLDFGDLVKLGESAASIKAAHFGV